MKKLMMMTLMMCLVGMSYGQSSMSYSIDGGGTIASSTTTFLDVFFDNSIDRLGLRVNHYGGSSSYFWEFNSNTINISNNTTVYWGINNTSTVYGASPGNLSILSIKYIDLGTTDTILYRTGTVTYTFILHNSSTTSTQDLIQESSIKVYPNPILNELTIQKDSYDDTNYSIINLTGQTLSSGTLTSSKSIIQTSDFPVGIYFVKIENEATFKIVKM
jgi:hypothetical protein